MKKQYMIGIIIITVFMVACTATQDKSIKKPKYIFYFIGDGMGVAQRTVTEYYQQRVLGEKKKLAMHTLPVSAEITTYSSDSLVPDSAATATALSSGYNTYNGAIGMNNNLEEKTTIMEALAQEGFVTGLITTTRVTHATPASFMAHEQSRGMENEIATDLSSSGVDLLLGGGYRHFVEKDNALGSKRMDAGLLNMFQAENYEMFVGEENTQRFLDASLVDYDKVLGLFSYTHIPYAIDRSRIEQRENKVYPSLDQLAKKGIEFLYNKGKDSGFMVMIEGGRIDHAAHANDPLTMIYETLEFDAAVQEALNFYNEHPDDTLILITADHETGGLTLGARNNEVDENGQSTQKYKLYLEKLSVAQFSLPDELDYAFQIQFDSDKNAFINYVKKDYGLGTLSSREMEILDTAMEYEIKNPDVYDNYAPTMLAISHIISLRANIGWSTQKHTGVMVGFAALGVGASNFTGYYDNSEALARLVAVLDIPSVTSKFL